MERAEFRRREGRIGRGHACSTPCPQDPVFVCPECGNYEAVLRPGVWACGWPAEGSRCANPGCEGVLRRVDAVGA